MLAATEVSHMYRRLNVISALFLVLLISSVQFIQVDEDEVRVFGAGSPRLCWVRALTQRPCPTCGLSRSTLMSLQGNLAGSAASHPSGTLVAIWIVVQALLRGVLAVGAKRKSIPYTDLAVSLIAFLCAVYAPWFVG
jgi:hypothetical protein